MPLHHVLLAISVAAIWGANFAFVKLGLSHFPPLLLTGLRFFIVAGLLVPFVPFPRRQLATILKLSVILGTIHFSLAFIGMSMGLNVSTVILAAQMGVPFSAILGTVMLGDRLGPWRSAGMGLAFLGLVVLAGTPNVTDHSFAFFLVIGSAFVWGYSNILIKQMGPIHILQVLGWMALFTAPQLVLLSMLFEVDQVALLETITQPAFISLLYSAMLSTIYAYGVWYWLLRRHPVSLVVPFQLLAPVFGIVVSQWMFDEKLPPGLWIGGALTLIGVGIITLRRPKWLVAGEGS